MNFITALTAAAIVAAVSFTESASESTCASTEFKPTIYETVLVWTMRGWRKMLPFLADPKVKVDLTLPIQDSDFPANGSMKIVFSRDTYRVVHFFARLQSENPWKYNMQLQTVVGKSVFHEPQPSNSWTYSEFKYSVAPNLAINASSLGLSPDSDTLMHQSQWQYSSGQYQYQSQWQYQGLNQTHGPQPRKWQLNTTYVGFPYGVSYMQLGGYIAKEENATNSTIEELTFVIKISALGPQNFTETTVTECDPVPDQTTTTSA